MISLFPKVHVKTMPSGRFDAWCRCCQTRALIELDETLGRFKQKHGQCPEGK